MKRLLKILFSFLILSFFLVPQAKAADLNIDCPASPASCSTSRLDPLFSNSLDGFWYPGKSITKALNLKNSGSETREMAIKGTKTSDSILENVMHISIVGGTTVIWSGSVADFYSKDKIGMGTFAPGANLNYDFTVFMSSDADDNYQNKETVFDLTLGFWGEPLSTATPTPTSTPNPTSVPGGGGAVLGAGVSAPVCTDTMPGGAPILTSAIGGVNSVTLTWTSAPDPVTYYLVTYGTTPGAQTYGNPNVGGHSTISYTVNGLSGGTTTYYFRIRAGNGCTPGPYSNELSATAGGKVLTGPAVGFIPGVLGTTTQSPETAPSASGEVKGTSCLDKNYLWWLPLVIQLMVGIVIFRLFRKEQPKIVKRLVIIIVGLAIISQAVHEWLGCNCATSIWCSRYLVFNLLVLIISLLVLGFLQKRNK